MEPGADEICSGSNSSGMHSLQCSSQQQLNMHQQKKEEIQQHGEQQHQQLMQEWQQQLEDPSDQQEQFELDQAQHPEQSQLQPYVENEHRHLEPPQLQPYVENEHRHLENSQLQQKQQWQADQQQQLQQVQMQQMLQHTQQQHLQEIHSQQQKLQQSQDQQELVTQLQQQLQPQQQESPSQSEQKDMEVRLQQQDLPLQELELQLQQQELALQLQQQQLTPQMPHEDLKQLTQAQQQQLEQSAAEPQQQHLKQLQQSQQHLQQPQQQLSQHFPLQPQQQYVPQSQQQPQQSSLEPQHQHLQPLSQNQQLPLHSQQQHLPQPQQQTQQQQLQLLSQHQQQSEQLPLQSQEQHLPQSQQRPQQQLQQSTLASQHQHLQQLPQPQQQPQLQQAPLPSQQQHLQQLTQSQQQPQQKLQQMSLQQQQQHLQQSQQQAQQHLQQASMSSHQQTQQQMPQLQQQLPHPQQQHLQPSSQPQKQHLQQLPQSQQQRSQQLPQAQQQLQQPQPQQQRSQLQPHMQQLSQSQQQLQQKQLQPQVQQQQQLSSQHPSQPAAGQAAASVRGQNISGSHSISFGSLIPMILPHLSKEQSDRLQGLYTRLRRNEVTKEDFLRATRNVVGDQMLVQAVRQMQHKHQGQSQLAPSSQASQLHQQQLQQQQQRQQQHAQGSSQQFLPQQSIHTQQVNEPQPFQQVSPTNLQPQAQNTSDFQPHSQSSAPASLTVPHTSSDNKTQQSRQPGEPRPEISSVHGNQTTTMNLHQVKHEVDRTMIGFPISSQQQQHLQVPPSSFPMYVRPPGNYSSQSFSASPGIPLGGVKALPQDSQLKQVMHPQVGVQAHGGPPQLSNIKNMSKFDLSKQAKRREDEERQKIMQSSGAAHFSGQHQPSVWATSLDKEKAGNTGISPSSSVHIKQEINDNSDQQHNFQTLQPMKDNLPTIKAGPMDHGQSLMLTKTDSIEHQSIKASGISSVNHPLGSSGLHSDHLMQAPLATSAATLHHTLSGFSGPVQMRPQVPSTPPSAMVGSQIKTPPKKMLIGQKKPFDASGSSMQLANKKQKVSTGYLDQSIDQLNDVTAVSGVNLREEEEQLFAGPKEESRATEAMRKVVQEEEERIFLQKGSFRTKLAGIMAKYGIKYISSDSERCLSLCVEERLRTMIGHLIRLSKQRVDLERASHKVTITSDVQRQILAMNKKAKDDLEKKQAEEAEKLRKLNEIENVGTEGEKDETRTKAQKAQKEEDDKMRANAANVAARAAVGGDDMLSKWQLMAEQARQKREGTSDGASNTRTNKDANRKSVVGGLKSTNVSDHQDTPSTGVVQNLGRTSGPLSQTKPVRSICIKDVIALLEREPQMTKSTLLYRLYERDVDCSKEKGTEVQNNENTLQ